MINEILDFKTPSKPFALEVRGSVVLSFDLQGTTLIDLEYDTIRVQCFGYMKHSRKRNTAKINPGC